MFARYDVGCDVSRPDWPPIPLVVPCGSARTLGVIGLKSRHGLNITGCRVRITNADGVSLSLDCVKDRGIWCVTFPASHFQTFGAVKNGVVVFAVGRDERDAEQLWIARIIDLRVVAIDSSSSAGEGNMPRDVYHKSEVVDGVQHYKKEVLVYSERQRAWGAEYVGDFVFVGGDFVPYSATEG